MPSTYFLVNNTYIWHQLISLMNDTGLICVFMLKKYTLKCYENMNALSRYLIHRMSIFDYSLMQTVIHRFRISMCILTKTVRGMYNTCLITEALFQMELKPMIFSCKRSITCSDLILPMLRLLPSKV